MSFWLRLSFTSAILFLSQAALNPTSRLCKVTPLATSLQKEPNSLSKCQHALSPAAATGNDLLSAASIIASPIIRKITDQFYLCDDKDDDDDDDNAIVCRQRELFRPRIRWITMTIALALNIGATIVLSPCHAAETIGKDPNCNDSSCLGVWDGLFANCPPISSSSNFNSINNAAFLGLAGCTSSQDDTPGIFAEPWDYSEFSNLDWKEQMEALVPTLQLVSAARGDGVSIHLKEGRYLRVAFTDVNTRERSIGEFYFTPNDATVQFRIGSDTSRPIAFSLQSSLRNMDRGEMIRKRLGYLKLPVLRNRRRTFWFGESDFDTFGPGSAALGPPSEMTLDEVEGLSRKDIHLR